MKISTLIIVSFLFIQCQTIESQENTSSNPVTINHSSPEIINKDGTTIQSRFNPPEGFQRQSTTPNSFEDYLRNLPLKPDESKVLHFDGSEKWNQAAAVAVVDLDVGKRDLQQCADAVMRLRAEYLWKENQFENIHFNYTNGFKADYKKWQEGYRIKVNGRKVSWVKSAKRSASYQDFRKYLTQVYIYAGTLSLSKELKPVKVNNLKIGDVFIQGGSPGHAIIVVDVAKSEQTGKTVFLLAQSYMPAQDIHVLTNPKNTAENPWYDLDFGNELESAEWTFEATDLRRF